MPMPLSVTLISTSEPDSWRSELDPAALGGVLGGVVQEIGEDLGEPRRVDVEHDRALREVRRAARACNRRAEAGSPARRARRPGRARSALSARDDLSAGDPGDVEQVVDDAGHVLDLLGDDVDRPVEVGPARPFDAHDLNGVADRSQRVSQLVGEHGEEVILALVGVAERFLHSLAVVDVGDDRADAQDRAVGGLDRVEAAKPVRARRRLSLRSRTRSPC